MTVRAKLGVTLLLGIYGVVTPLGSSGAEPSPGSGFEAPPPGASSCSGCHGTGASPTPLTGRDPAVTVADLDAFRDGKRPATVMDRIVKGFSRDETVAIANWLAVQK